MLDIGKVWILMDPAMVLQRFQMGDDLDGLLETGRQPLLDGGGDAVRLSQRELEGKEQMNLDDRAMAGAAKTDAVVADV